ANTQQLHGAVVVLANRGVEGCKLQLTTQTTQASQSVFVWRFGVLLTADAAAQTTLPGWPLAPQHEVAAVSGG
ncbi:MAG TPA: hypothetical protein VKT52_11345, partial [Ktedonobacterales bacterium]|nr:hypothetical protein [Ktedonobacterales bacterium]